MNEGSESKDAVFGFAASFANSDGSWNIFPIPVGSAASESTTKILAFAIQVNRDVPRAALTSCKPFCNAGESSTLMPCS